MSYNILLKENMLTKIANITDIHIKHLQIDDNDLTISEKYSILETLLIDKPAIFLERYHAYLDIQDVALFDNLRDSTMVDHYIKQIEINHKQKQIPNSSKFASRNKHYLILEQLIEEGEYFSDYEMKKRDPYLYEQMVGQYLDDDEIAEQAKSASSSLLSRNLLNHLQSVQNNELYEKQLENEKEITEEYESDDADDNLNRATFSQEMNDKELLRKEFTAVMHQRFLDGLDDFDYNDIKYNQDLEPLELLSREKEDAYFDEDDASDRENSIGDEEISLKMNDNDDNCTSYEDDIFIKKSVNTDENNLKKIENEYLELDI